MHNTLNYWSDAVDSEFSYSFVAGRVELMESETKIVQLIHLLRSEHSEIDMLVVMTGEHLYPEHSCIPVILTKFQS